MNNTKTHPGPYKLGDKLTLIRTSRKNDAYTDQMGRKHIATVLQEIVIVTISEVKNVPGIYEKDTYYEGYIALSEDGRKFGCCEDRFDETNTRPHHSWSWLTDIRKHVLSGNSVCLFFFEEASAALNDASIDFPGFGPMVDKDGKPVETVEGVECCKKHKRGKHFYRASQGCCMCKYNVP